MVYIFVGAFFLFIFVAYTTDMWFALQTGDTIPFICFVIYGAVTFWCLSRAIKKGKTLPRPLQIPGWVIAALGVCLFLYDLGDWTGMFNSVGFSLAGLCVVYFARLRKKPVKSVFDAPAPVITPKSTGPAISAGKSLSELFQEVRACPSVQNDPNFRNLLIETQRLYTDLQTKDVHISQTLPDQMRKLLETYLDLDDDPVQTSKTLEMEKEIRDGFQTIYGALQNLYDRHLAASQMDLESDIEMLEIKLRQDGLLDSDFQINHEK